MTQPPLGLHTDLYELRMVQTYLRHGMTGDATFSLFVRPTATRPWFLAAGLHRVLEVLDHFRYDGVAIDYLRTFGIDEDTLAWLAELAPRGEVTAIAEGTVVLADEPLLQVTAPLPFAQLLETALMNVVHLATLIATKAARCVLAAQGRLIADFGTRRAHGLEAGLEAARSAYLAGCVSTSNVEAGRRYGIPLVGTMAHSLIQAWGDEEAAFEAFVRDHPTHSTLLVDTYDTMRGVARAIAGGDRLRERGQELVAIRLDSGDLHGLAVEARRALDAAGHTGTLIIASGGVDERVIGDLVASGAPIDAFGVGTAMTVSRDTPALDIVYKLVEYDGVAHAKYSTSKVSLPGAKQVFRRGDPSRDVLGLRGEDLDGERLLEPIWRDGEMLVGTDLEAARERARAQLAMLPDAWHAPSDSEGVPRPQLSPALRALADEVRTRELAR